MSNDEVLRSEGDEEFVSPITGGQELAEVQQELTEEQRTEKARAVTKQLKSLVSVFRDRYPAQEIGQSVSWNLENAYLNLRISPEEDYQTSMENAKKRIEDAKQIIEKEKEKILSRLDRDLEDIKSIEI